MRNKHKMQIIEKTQTLINIFLYEICSILEYKNQIITKY